MKLNILLNTNLNGLPIEDINLAMITKLKQQAGIYDGIIAEVMDAVAAVIREMMTLRYIPAERITFSNIRSFLIIREQAN